ncbi:hypothetical protein C8R44DRAFT_232497 [Mycena epipterygia]|nr:hypothetical protein C8R44DRAFT_232497 [Mycena epipterygia]
MSNPLHLRSRPSPRTPLVLVAALYLRCPTILAAPLLLPSSRASHLTYLLPCTPHDANPPDALNYPFLLVSATNLPPPPCPPSHVWPHSMRVPLPSDAFVPHRSPPFSMYSRRHSSSTLRVVSPSSTPLWPPARQRLHIPRPALLSLFPNSFPSPRTVLSYIHLLFTLHFFLVNPPIPILAHSRHCCRRSTRPLPSSMRRDLETTAPHELRSRSGSSRRRRPRALQLILPLSAPSTSPHLTPRAVVYPRQVLYCTPPRPTLRSYPFLLLPPPPCAPRASLLRPPPFPFHVSPSTLPALSHPYPSLPAHLALPARALHPPRASPTCPRPGTSLGPSQRNTRDDPGF